MRASPNYILREIADEIMLVPVGVSAAKLNGMILLNKTGGSIFKALAEERTLEELTAIIAREYEIDTETARGDIDEFLQNLRQVDALIEE